MIVPQNEKNAILLLNDRKGWRFSKFISVTDELQLFA